MDTTPRLQLPLIQPGQASKHVTHNEALARLDMLSAVSVLSTDLTSPPEIIESGDIYRVAVPASGVWSGLDDHIVIYVDGQWISSPCPDGMLVFVRDRGEWEMKSGAVWNIITSDMGDAATPSSLSVNTSVDPQNRVSIKARSVLMSHDDVTPDGGDVRLTLNKAAQSDTAGLLFSRDFNAHAEIGLVGQDDLQIRVSTDGQSFTPALTVSRTTGQVSLPQGFQGPVPLSGEPLGGLAAYDELYINPLSGNDAYDGQSAGTAVKTVSGIAARFRVGRRLRIYLLGDIDWDEYVSLSYTVPKLTLAGLTPAGAYTNRTIRVQDSVNVPGYPGCLVFEGGGTVEFLSVNVELASSSSSPFLLFNGTLGLVTTENMTVTRTGSGSGHVWGTHRCFVPNFHTNLTIDASAQGYVAFGVAAGADPNSMPNYTSNITAM